MAHTPCQLQRLRQQTRRLSCPFMLQFQIKILAKIFISKRRIIIATITFKTLKINNYKTPLQREIVANASHYSSQTHLIYKLPLAKDPRQVMAGSSIKISIVSPEYICRRNRSSLELMPSTGLGHAVVDLDISSSHPIVQPPSKLTHLVSRSPNSPSSLRLKNPSAPHLL